MANPQDTVKQIAHQLGLQDPDQFRRATVGGRQSGRTTRAILWALSDVLKGKRVCFMAPTREKAAEMVYAAREYARRLGVDPALIQRPIPYGVTNNPRWWPSGVTVHKDHTLNYSGGQVNEPQTAYITSPGTHYIDCPWCRTDMEIPIPRELCLLRGFETRQECFRCHAPVRLVITNVRVQVQAWRADDIP